VLNMRTNAHGPGHASRCFIISSSPCDWLNAWFSICTCSFFSSFLFTASLPPPLGYTSVSKARKYSSNNSTVQLKPSLSRTKCSGFKGFSQEKNLTCRLGSLAVPDIFLGFQLLSGNGEVRVCVCVCTCYCARAGLISKMLGFK